MTERAEFIGVCEGVEAIEESAKVLPSYTADV
jgi:hypothetical protein